MKKIKKIIFSILIFLNSTVSKVLGQAEYGVIEPYVKEETMPEKIVSFLQELSQKIAIPIVLLIGIIIYFAKSKKGIKHKIIILLIVADIYIVGRIIIYYIYKNI